MQFLKMCGTGKGVRYRRLYGRLRTEKKGVEKAGLSERTSWGPREATTERHEIYKMQGPEHIDNFVGSI